MDHHHPHGEKEMRAYLPIYLKAWGLTFVIAGIELIGSIMSGSLALLADITHVFTDTLVGLGPVSVEFFRHRLHLSAKKIEAVVGLAVSLILAFVGYHVLHEAIEHLGGESHHDVDGVFMFLFSALAAMTNFLQHRLLSRVSPIHRHAAHAGFHFHVLTDLMKNIALPLIAGVIYFGGPEILDIWAGIVIGGLILLRSLILAGESIIGEPLVARAVERFFRWIAR
jgi:cobalt-zinc-cadmium efflux system protein